MSRLIRIPLSAALSLPIAESTRDWMHVFASTTVEGEQLAPYQYRVLFAYTFQPMAELLTLHVAAWLFWFLSLSVLALLIDEIMTAVNPDGDKAPLIVSLALIPGLLWFHPGGAVWSVLEGVFFAGAILAMIKGRTAVLYPLVFVATLNRETAILIPLMVLFWDWRHAAGLLSIWLVAYVGIHLIIGDVPSQFTLSDIWQLNTGPGFLLFLMGLPLFGWLFWYAGKGWRNAPDVLRGTAVIIPAYVVLFGMFGIWYEWRWILSLYPVLVPLAGLAKRQEVGVKQAAVNQLDVTPATVLN